MSILDRIEGCNHFDKQSVYPFLVANQQIGWLKRKHQSLLEQWPQWFSFKNGKMTLSESLNTHQRRTLAFKQVIAKLRKQKQISSWESEYYDVMPSYGELPLFEIERSATSFWGIPSYGTHLNGYTYKEGKLHLWIAKRAKHLAFAPEKLDNLAAGGLPQGLTPHENIINEAWEEAQIPRQIMEIARQQGSISYLMDLEHGVALDTMFVFDLELLPNFEPKTDGSEIEVFYCMPAEEVYHLLKNTQTFKYNSALVIIDFLIRKGNIVASEPDFDKITYQLYRNVHFKQSTMSKHERIPCSRKAI